MKLEILIQTRINKSLRYDFTQLLYCWLQFSQNEGYARILKSYDHKFSKKKRVKHAVFKISSYNKTVMWYKL